MPTESKNVGEWSELYVLMEIADLRKISMCNANLTPLAGSELHASKIFRPEGEVLLGNVVETLDTKGNQLAILTRSQVSTLKDAFKAELLAALPRTETERKQKKQLKAGNDVLKALHLKKVSVGSDKKEDIELQVIDPKAKTEGRSAFSIKSSLGAPPTLFNASQATRICYHLKDFSGLPEDVNRIDSSRKLLKRVDKIKELGGRLVFDKYRSPIFEGNLRKIDSLMPEILANAVKAAMSRGANNPKGKHLAEVIQSQDFLRSLSSLPVKLTTEDVVFKFKNLLLDMALGMKADSDWHGRHRADGGYIIVRDDAEVLCLHMVNLSDFADYLISKVYFEAAGSSKHQYGIIYPKGNGLYFDYACQLRFKV